MFNLQRKESVVTGKIFISVRDFIALRFAVKAGIF